MKHRALVRTLVITALFLAAQAARAQQSPARRLIYYATLPSTCNASTGDVAIQIGGTNPGPYYCSATNTWTAIGGTAGLFLAGNGTAAAPSHSFVSDPDTGMYRAGANQLGFSVNGANIITADATNLAYTGTFSASGTGTHVFGIGTNLTSSFYIGSNAGTGLVIDGAGGPLIALRRANGTQAARTIVLNNDQALRLVGFGWDGAAYQSAGEIKFEVDGTPGANDMPSRIVFYTTPDGGTTSTERMRIDNAGKILLAAITFANIAVGSTTNGTYFYCSDCTIANPCAGGGTGALAKRLNGVWVCN